MVLLTALALLTAAGGTYFLSSIVSQLLQPLSIAAALIAAVVVFLWAEDRRLLRDVPGGQTEEAIAHGLLAAVVGLIVFKAIGYVLAVGLTLTAIIILLLLVIGGPFLLLSVVRGGFSLLR